MMGISLVLLDFFSKEQAVKPFISGIKISNKIKSGTN